MDQGTAHLFQYPTKSGVGLESSRNGGLVISTLKVARFAAHNRSGGAIDMGLLRKLPNPSWKVHKLVDLSTPDATDITTDIQAGIATTIFEAQDDGILIQSRKRFGLIRFTATVVSVNLTGVFRYFDGSNWVALTTIEKLAQFSIGSDNYLVFAPPVDWQVGTTAAVGGDTTLYSIRYTSSSATTTDPIITSLDIGEFIRFKDSVASNGILELTNTREFPLELEASEDLMPYFAAASVDNIVEATYLEQG